MNGILNDDIVFNEVVNAGGWHQNARKADLVPCNMGGTKNLLQTAKSDDDYKQLVSCIKEQARHLGGTVVFNQSWKYEL